MTGIWTTWQCRKCNQLNVAFLEKKKNKETLITCTRCGSKGLITFQPLEETQV